MLMKSCRARGAAVAARHAGAFAQDPTGTIEGAVTDKTRSARCRRARRRRQPRHRLHEGGDRRRPTASTACCCCRSARYSVTVEAPQFATLVQEPIQVNVSQTVRVNVQLELLVADARRSPSPAARSWSTPSTNALGRVVTGRELVDLPLNGRNFTQLGLLQTGVAPLTAGVATAGGSLRQGQAYAVNGMRPEQNVYLVDGAQNMNRMDGGYALKLPVDAIAEFRILTQSAPPEYGGTGGATTSVVTRSGGNQFHGSLYEFVRNDAFDARNFFSAEVEPLKQNQFGGTIGGPILQGSRCSSSATTRASATSRAHDDGHGADGDGARGRLLRHGTPLLNFAAGGVPFPGNQIPPAAINPVARNVLNLYPLGNVSPSIYRETLVGKNVLDQAGGRVDFNAVGQRPVLRALLLLGRPQHQPDLGARHRRARASRRATTSRRTRPSCRARASSRRR